MPGWIYVNSTKFLNTILALAGMIPLGRLVYLGYQDALTANPIEYITRFTGTWALIFLCLTLSVTPMRKLTGFSRLLKFRRTLGLLVFFYATLHALIWIWLDQNFDNDAMVADILKRPFITMGVTSFILLCPLAITSNQRSINVLKRRWSQIHALIYFIAITVVLHYWWHKSGKNDYAQVSVYAIIVSILLGYRVFAYRLKRAS
jgi:sulfoxide reductase heme-binding subunit YedZ